MDKLRVLWAGHIGANTGYGRATRDWCRALLTQEDIELEVLNLGSEELTDPIYIDVAERIVKAKDPDIVSEPDVVVVHERIPWAPQWWNDKHIPRVLATAWEVRGASDEVRRIASLYDRIVVPSQLSREWLHYFADVVPHAVDLDWLLSFRRNRQHNKLYTFLYVGSWNDRKNPAGVLKAYLAAFYHGDPVQLIMHCSGLTEDNLLEAKGILAASGLAPNELPKLTITDGSYRSNFDLEMLYTNADAFVTASRGEGFNLGALEAAATGCVIISTPEGAPFLDGNFFFLDPITSAEVPVFPAGTVRPAAGGVRYESCFPRGVTCKQSWGEPDLGELAGRMQMAVQRNPFVTDRVPESVLRRFSYDRVGRTFADLLRDVVKQHKEKKGS